MNYKETNTQLSSVRYHHACISARQSKSMLILKTKAKLKQE